MSKFDVLRLDLKTKMLGSDKNKYTIVGCKKTNTISNAV
jgi:hypothetical protein